MRRWKCGMWVLFFALAGPVIADEPEQDPWIGTWEKKGDNGDVVFLEIQPQEMRWTLQHPKNTAVMRVPRYQVHREKNTLFGYVDHIGWSGDVNSGNLSFLNPFACQIHCDQQQGQFHLRNLRMFGADQKFHEQLQGTYERQVAEVAARPETPADKP